MVLVVHDEDSGDITLPVSRISSLIIIMAYCAYILFQLVTHREAMHEDEGGEDDDEGSMSIWLSMLLLMVTTVIIAYSSELLVNAIRGVTESAHLSEHFI